MSKVQKYNLQVSRAFQRRWDTCFVRCGTIQGINPVHERSCKEDSCIDCLLAQSLFTVASKHRCIRNFLYC